MKVNSTYIFLSAVFLLSSHYCNGQQYFEKASKEYFTGDIRKSVDLFTLSIENKEELAKSYMYRAAAESFLDMFDDALFDLNMSKALDSTNPKLYYYYGKLHLFKGDYEKSIQYYTKAIAKDPKDAYAYDERAGAKILAGDFNGAIADEDIAISINDSIEYFYTDRAAAKMRLNRYNEAINDFTTSLKLEPNQKAYANRGIAYAVLGNHQKAVDDYTKSLEMIPGDAEILYYRGISYKAMKKNTEACSDLNKSRAIGYPKAPDALKEIKCD
jgi:tetratricopeptide (TPR) repeat protein